MRILLDGMPKMLRTIIRNIVLADPQCEIVAETGEQNDLRAQLCATPADVIILALTDWDDRPDRFAALLVDNPASRVIGITPGGTRAFLYDLRPHLTYIDELTPAALLSAISQPSTSAPSGA